MRQKARIVYDLRFDKESMANSLTKEKPSFERHLEYFKEHADEYKIINGSIYLRIDNQGFISIAVAKNKRNKGLAASYLRKLKKGKAIILNDNYPSLICFLKSGFKIKGFYLEKWI